MLSPVLRILTERALPWLGLVATVLVVLAVAVRTGWPGGGPLFHVVALVKVLLVLALVGVGFAVGVLGSRGVAFGTRWVRRGWRLAALAGLTVLCMTTAWVEVERFGPVVFVAMWLAWAGCVWALLNPLRGTPVGWRRAVLAVPWLLTALFSAVLWIGYAHDVAVASAVLWLPLALVTFAAVGLVPGLLVAESVHALGEGRLIGWLTRQRARGVWLVLLAKAVLVAVVLVLNWRWLAESLSWGTWLWVVPAVLLLLGLLAFDHRLPLFRGRHQEVARGLGLLVSVPITLVVFLGVALVALLGLGLDSFVAPAVLVFAFVGLLVLRWWVAGDGVGGRRPRWAWLLAGGIGVLSGALALAAAYLTHANLRGLRTPMAGLAVPAGWWPALFLGAFAAMVLVLVILVVRRRHWGFLTLAAVLALWLGWALVSTVMTAPGERSGFVLVGPVLVVALALLQFLARAGRQRAVDEGEILRFGLATLFAVDLPSVLLYLPDSLSPVALGVGFGIPAVAVVVGVFRRRVRLRSVALLAAVFAPLWIGDVTMASFNQPTMTEQLEAMSGDLFQFVALPLAAVLSVASAHSSGARPRTAMTAGPPQA